MFCKNCGKNLGEENKELCAECEATLKTEVSDNETVEVVKEVESNNNSNTTNNNGSTKTPKSKIAAGLLGIFLGSLGVHNFYLGYTGKAVAQLLISILSCGMLSAVSGLWGLIEGILILTGEISTDADGITLRD